MKILVTGASGFIGGHVCEELHERGHRIRALVRRADPPPHLLALDDLEIARGDLTDSRDVDRMVRGMEAVIHAAAKVNDWGPLREFVALNHDATKDLLETGRQGGVETFVYLSSVAVQGFGTHVESTEEGPYYPVRSAYSVSKKMAEDLVLSQNAPGFKTTAVRPGNVYGARDRATFYNIFRYLERGLMGYVDQGRHLTTIVSIDNLVDGVVKALERPESGGRALIVCDPVKLTWKVLQEHICSLLGVQSGRLNAPAWLSYIAAYLCAGAYHLAGARSLPPLTPYRIRHVAKDYHFVPDLARRIIGYEPVVDWREGMRRAVEAYLAGKEESDPAARS